MNSDVIVIGAGFWGSAISLELQACGQQVMLLDAGLADGASRVAAGLVRESSLEKLNPPWWKESHTAACRRFLESWGHRGQEFVVSPWQSARGASPAGRVRQGLWQLWPQEILQPALAYRVNYLQRQCSRWFVHCQNQVLTTPKVVLAAGIHCDTLLQNSGFKTMDLQPLPGSALLGRAGQALEMPHTRGYRLTGDTRTRTLTARNWGQGRLRVGDTCGPPEAGQMERLEHWFQEMGGQGPAQRLWGIRPKSPQGICVEAWAPGLIVASGGGRNGLASAAGVALRVRQLLSARGD